MPIDLRQWIQRRRCSKAPSRETRRSARHPRNSKPIRRASASGRSADDRAARTGSAFLDRPFLHQVLGARLEDETRSMAVSESCIVLASAAWARYTKRSTFSTDHPERVAVKIVRPGLARLDDLSLLLRRDIQLAHRITHPNVCKVHFLDVDKRPDGDLIFLVAGLSGRRDAAGPVEA